MEKIVKVALEAKFKGMDIEKLMEIIFMTPNIEHATEVLLGIYEEPAFKAIHKYTYKYKGTDFKDLEAAYSSFNPWLKELTVVVSRPKTIEIGVLKENYELVTNENYQDFELTKEHRNSREDWRWKVISLKEFENVKETVSSIDGLQEWYVTDFD